MTTVMMNWGQCHYHLQMQNVAVLEVVMVLQMEEMKSCICHKESVLHAIQLEDPLILV